MKIVFFTDTFPPQVSGVVTSVLNFSRELGKRGHQVYIFTLKQKKKAKLDLGPNVKIFYFPTTNLFVNYPDFKLVQPQLARTSKLIYKIKPDIIHTHCPSLHGWVALLCAKMFNIPIVSTYHTLLSDFLKHSFMEPIHDTTVAKATAWQYTRGYYNLVDLVISPSGAIKDELKKHGVKRKIEVVSNGVNACLFYPENLKKNGRRILHVGRISYEKNIDVLLKAFKIVIEKYPDAVLYIAGNGPDVDSLKELAKKLKIEKNINFLGNIEHEKLRQVYSGSDVFVTASTIETEGLVILEAMSCGMPVVGVNKLAMPYIVKNGANGFLVNPGDFRAIAEGMEKLLKDKELRDKFSKNSLKMSEKFSLNYSIDKIEHIYSNLEASQLFGLRNYVFNKKPLMLFGKV